jgi:hypothetical protein
MDLLVRLPNACSNQPLRVTLPSRETSDSNSLRIQIRIGSVDVPPYMHTYRQTRTQLVCHSIYTYTAMPGSNPRERSRLRFVSSLDRSATTARYFYHFTNRIILSTIIKQYLTYILKLVLTSLVLV